MFYKKNKWIQDKNCYLLSGDLDDVNYETGFHFFKSKKAAKNWITEDDETIRKVKARKIVASGLQYNPGSDSDSITCVAKEIFIED